MVYRWMILPLKKVSQRPCEEQAFTPHVVFSAVLRSQTQLQKMHLEARDRISPLPTELLPILSLTLFT